MAKGAPWEDAPDYLVDKRGRVWSTKTNRYLKPALRNGYPFVSIRVGDKQKNVYIHRMVASIYIPNPDNLPEVNHIDRDKTNSNVSNLEWVSKHANMEHALAKSYSMRNPEGEKVFIHNMEKFCKGTELDPSSMIKVYYGKYRTHKGWTRDG